MLFDHRVSARKFAQTQMDPFSQQLDDNTASTSTEKP